MSTTMKTNPKSDPDDVAMDALPPSNTTSSRHGLELSVDPTVANASHDDEARGVTPSPTFAASAVQQGFGGDDDSSSREKSSNDDDDDDDEVEVVPSPVASATIATQPKNAPVATTGPSQVVSGVPTAATNTNTNETVAQAQARAEARAAAAAAAIQKRKEAKAKERADQLELDDFFDAHNNDKFAGIAPYQKPEGFKSSVNLFDYQQDGVRWLIHQEEHEKERLSPFWKERESTVGTNNRRWFCQMGKLRLSQAERPTPDRGAILADDMGLGKSIQTLGLILSCMPQEGDKSAPRATLIVCPVSVMASWQLQISRFVKKDYLTVVEYLGPHRHKILTRIKRKNDIDIILASYETLNSDFKQFELDNAEKEEEEEEEASGQKAQKKKKKARKNAWTSSGNDSEEDWSMGSESEDEDDHHLSKSMLSEKKRNPSIFEFEFHRVVLDEGHRIRNGKTGSFKACSALVSDRRLVISGTPFVNRPSDIHSIIAFLNPTGYQSQNPLVPLKSFNDLVVQPIKECKLIGLSRCRALMSHIGLRRTKNLVDQTLGIPSKTVEVITVPFPEGFHKETHDILYETAREVFISMIAGGGREMYRCFYQFFTLVLRVRQCCDHGGMIPAEQLEQARTALDIIADNGGGGEINMDASEARGLLDKLMEALKPSSEVDELALECAVCLDNYDEDTAVCLRGCAHVFCSDCMDGLHGQQKSCPLCRAKFKQSDKISVEACKAAIKKKKQQEKRKKKKLTDWDGEEQAPKIISLLEQIERMADDEKGVIFSQFTEFLNLIETALDEAGHTYTRIDGSVAHPERLEAMKALDAENGPRFMLVSIRAAGEGLTLVRANVCFLMDPWWNAAVQDQAADRVHRIGQTRPVRVYQFVMKDSIEKRMLTLQEAKTALGNGSLRKLSKEEAKKARITAMKDLFQVHKAAQWSGRFDDDEDENDDGSDLDGFIVNDDDYE